MTSGMNTTSSALSLGGMLLTGALLAGCGTSVATLPVSTLTEDSAAAVTQVQVEPKSDSPSSSTNTESLRYTVRKTVTPRREPTIPPVLLSAGHAKLCLVQVGDPFPALSLPRLGGPTTELASLRGQQATVVLFWHSDRWMARTALIDMQRDLVSQFDAKQVAVVGIAVHRCRPSGSEPGAGDFPATSRHRWPSLRHDRNCRPAALLRPRPSRQNCLV